MDNYDLSVTIDSDGKVEVQIVSTSDPVQILVLTVTDIGMLGDIKAEGLALMEKVMKIVS